MPATDRRGQLVVVHGDRALVNGERHVRWMGVKTLGPKVLAAWVYYDLDGSPQVAHPRLRDES